MHIGAAEEQECRWVYEKFYAVMTEEPCTLLVVKEIWDKDYPTRLGKSGLTPLSLVKTVAKKAFKT